MQSYIKIPKSELLSSNEALKSFGKLWKDHPGDVMMMQALIEYEFGRDRNYSEKDMGIVKYILAQQILFFKGCTQEWKEFEKTQQRQLER